MSKLKTSVLYVFLFIAILVWVSRDTVFSKRSPVSVNSGHPVIIKNEDSTGVIPVLNSSNHEVLIVGGYTSCSCVATFDYPLRLKPNEITEIPFVIGDTFLKEFHARWFLDHPEQFELNILVVRQSNTKEHQ